MYVGDPLCIGSGQTDLPCSLQHPANPFESALNPLAVSTPISCEAPHGLGLKFHDTMPAIQKESSSTFKPLCSRPLQPVLGFLETLLPVLDADVLLGQ